MMICCRLKTERLTVKKQEAAFCCYVSMNLFKQLCSRAKLSNYESISTAVRIVASAMSNMQIILNIWTQSEADEGSIDEDPANLKQQLNSYYQSLLDTTLIWLQKQLPGCLVALSPYYPLEKITWSKKELLVSQFCAFIIANFVTLCKPDICVEFVRLALCACNNIKTLIHCIILKFCKKNMKCRPFYLPTAGMSFY
jgi:hypothetical protein